MDLIDQTRLIQGWAGVRQDGSYGPLTAGAIIAKAGICGPAPIGHNAPPPCRELTGRMVLELIEHEGIVLEAYKDSVGVWTWGLGVTDESGHRVGRYRDNPQTLARCLEVSIWLLRERYLPTVLRAFGDRPLAEHELAAALSFHWNTGAISRASWVKSVVAGRDDEAREQIMDWRKPVEILGRRKAESNLFFKGQWTSDGIVPVYGVSKPSYAPRNARMVDIRPDLAVALGGATGNGPPR